MFVGQTAVGGQELKQKRESNPVGEATLPIGKEAKETILHDLSFFGGAEAGT